MARPLEFCFTIYCKDPKATYEALLSARPSPEAMRTLREASQLDMSSLEMDDSEDRDAK